MRARDVSVGIQETKDGLIVLARFHLQSEPLERELACVDQAKAPPNVGTRVKESSRKRKEKEIQKVLEAVEFGHAQRGKTMASFWVVNNDGDHGSILAPTENDAEKMLAEGILYDKYPLDAILIEEIANIEIYEPVADEDILSIEDSESEK